MTETKLHSLIKPSQHTRFRIDFEWWQQKERDWHVHLWGLLCPEHQKAFANPEDNLMVDWVDPNTAEVQQVEGLQHLLITHCAKEPDFITPHTTLVDAVFRLFLANGNTPLTPIEMSEALHRPPDTILKTLTGSRVYRGVRPCPEC